MKKKRIIFISIFTILIFSYIVKKVMSNNQALTLYGNIDIRDVALGFEETGRIIQLNYEEGDRVNKGDVIAVLDKNIFEKQLALSTAQLEQAKALLGNSELEFKRQKELFAQKITSQKNYDDCQTQLQEAIAGLSVAQANVDLNKIKLEHSELKSSDEGIIITRAKEVGSIVSTGMPIYILALDKPVWVRTYIDEPNLGMIYNGQKVEISTDSGDKYEGQIGFISPQAEFTPNTVQTTELRTSLVYRLRVIIDNPDKGIRQGMPVTIKIKN